MGKRNDPNDQSRRNLLKWGGIAGVGAVLAGGSWAAGAATASGEGSRKGFAAAPNHFARLRPRKEPGFDHLVVVMGENRSFDNLLGYLYTPENLPKGASFEGLAFGDYSNTGPDGTEYPVHVHEGLTDDIMERPNPDPGEEYPHVNTQLFNRVDPEDNADLWVDAMKAPYNAPEKGQKPDNSGFVNDYYINYRRLLGGDEPPQRELKHIMGSFSPEMLPVLSTLAKEFAVFDHWFCAVPSQTFCNRSFFHSSTSHGFVTNMNGGGYKKWMTAKGAPTIFNELDDAGVDWRIYYDELQLLSFTGVLHAQVLEQFWKSDHFATMEQFYEDVKNGDLPPYSFIEPRMVYNHNDFHPPVGTLRESDVEGMEVLNSTVSDVRAGEALIHDIYSAIKNSASGEGSNAVNTLLLITFDEHGGTYDHVAPPAAKPPHSDAKPGEMGFTFDRLGCRVPAIAVSAYTAKNTIINDQMDHGSVLKTLCEQHGLAPLTDRDAESRSLSVVINQSEPRHPADWPETVPQWVPKNPEAEPPHPASEHSDGPLSPPAKGLVGLVQAKFGDGSDPKAETYADAYEQLQKYGAGVMGVDHTVGNASR